MKQKIEEIRQGVKVDLHTVKLSKDVEVLKVKYLGKKGPIQGLMKELRTVSAEDRPIVGKSINELKQEVQGLCEDLFTKLLEEEEAVSLEKEKIDVTLPGRRKALGRSHPISCLLDEVLDILTGMGFSVQYSPNIENDYYNFEALNFPPDHPARDMQDTFFIDASTVLRTHTSNTQVRVMEASEPPIRVVAPGKCFRNEEISARSHVIFHQVEAFYVDKQVTFADLKGTLEEFLFKLVGKELPIRMRPSYFPFVEPGMEVDIHCLSCSGNGCPICKYTGWLEILGAGMVHPEVLNSAGIDSEQYSGYAWGMGIERIALIRHGINDIRLFMENDLRFLSQL